MSHREEPRSWLLQHQGINAMPRAFFLLHTQWITSPFPASLTNLIPLQLTSGMQVSQRPSDTVATESL